MHYARMLRGTRQFLANSSIDAKRPNVHAGLRGDMGWLRELMVEAGPGFKSFGALARAALASPLWPEEVAVEARSLAAVFSKLDRGVDLEWLDDRPAVQLVLTEILDCSASEMDRPTRALRTREDDRVRLLDLPYARALDLRAEPPPPGPPPEVLHPERWGRIWWHAASGSGRSLVGRWLGARGRADFVDVLPGTHPPWSLGGPIFIELHESPAEALSETGFAERCCVAAPFWPEDVGLDPSCFVRVPPTLPSEFLPWLVDWVARRLPSDTRFESEPALEWLVEHALPLGLVDTPGSALGLCALMDEAGMEALRRCQLSGLVERYVLGRLTRVASRRPERTWFRDSHFQVLEALAEHWLVDAEGPWDTPRTRDQWLTRIPAELTRGRDLEWLRIGLPGANPMIRPNDVERAAQRLPPGGFRLLAVLEELGLLRAVGTNPEVLIPAPRWLWLGLMEHALQTVTGRSPLEWGEALLNPRLAERVAGALARRMRNDAVTAIEDVLELEAGDEPSYAAAIEVTFTRAGVELLSGCEIPSEPLGELFAEQLLLVVEMPGKLPGPVLGVPGEFGTSEGRHGLWLLCALAISEQLETRSGNVPLLNPWREARPDPRYRAQLDCIATAVIAAHARAEPWAFGAYRLVDRLRRVLGNSESDLAATHPLERPGEVLDQVVHGVLEWSALEPFSTEPSGLDALAQLADERKVPWESIAQAAWTAWNAAGRPESRLLALEHPRIGALWESLPVELLSEIVVGPARPRPAWARLGERHWTALASLLEESPERLEVASIPWRLAPQACLAQVLSSRTQVPQTVLEHIWRRYPEHAQRELARRLEPGTWALVELLRACPGEQIPRAADELSAPRVIRLPPPTRDAVREWLCHNVQQRPEGWRVLFRVLDQVERALRAATHQ